MPAGYAAVGYCPGTNLPNYVSKPDGTLACMTDAEIIALATFVNPGPNAPPATLVTPLMSVSTSPPVTTPAPSLPSLPSYPAPSAPLTAVTSSFDPTSFIEQYKWWIVGGVGAVALLVMMKG